MNFRKSASLWLLLLLWVQFTLSQARPSGSNKAASDPVAALGRGVVVEEIVQGYGGEQSGLEEGDLLLTWSRGEISGEIESPFDFIRIDFEQGALGGLVFHGFRGHEPRTWKMSSENWMVTVRPNFSDTLIASYREIREQEMSGKSIEASVRWSAAADDGAWSRPAWLRSWVLFRAAATLAAGPQSKASEDALEQAAAAARQSSPTDAVIMLLAWGDIYGAKLRMKNAGKYYRQATDEARKSGRPSQELVKGLAFQCYLIQNDSGMDHEPICNQALAEARSLAYESRYAVLSLGGLSQSARLRGDLIEFENKLNEILAIQKKIDPDGAKIQASAFISLGMLASDRGDLAAAERYDRQALVFAEKTLPRLGYLPAALNNLGELAEMRGNWAEAEDYLRQALEIKERWAPGGSFSASTLKNLGDVARNRNRPAEAEDWYRRTITLLEKRAPGGLLLAESQHALGELFSQNENPDGAEEYLRKALAIRERVAPSSAVHAETLAALASVLNRKGQPETAAQLYERALNALESQTARLGGSRDLQAGFRARHAAYYREYMELLLERNEPQAAFEVLERSRARSLLEMLAEAHSDIHTGVEPALLQEERKLRAQIAAAFDRRAALLRSPNDEQLSKAGREISELTAQYEALESRIRAASPAYAALTRPQPISSAEVQKLLAPKTLLLEYSLGEKHSHVWAVTADSLKSYDLPGRGQIEKQARRVYELLTARNRSAGNEAAANREARLVRLRTAFRAAAESLSTSVLGPVAAELKSNKLLVVSDGALQFVPFAALPEPGAGGRRKAPLIVRHEIVSLPSASVLAELRRQAASRRPPAKLVAVLADPVFDRNDARVMPRTGGRQETEEVFGLLSDRLARSVADFGPGGAPESGLHRLPYSRREAFAIRALTPPGQGMQALDFSASRRLATSGELAQYRIVHFSTHGLLDSRHPELSGLVLSLFDQDGRPQNGFLDLQDIYNLDLPADLVVLSACETALGKEIAGEGLVGLARGFMYAGAARVVASLWSVGDNATAELMSRFYRAMLREGLSPSAGLRRAQVEMWKDPRWSDAYFWGAFVVQGE